MKNKRVPGAILATAAVLMSLGVFWKMSEYGPGQPPDHDRNTL